MVVMPFGFSSTAARIAYSIRSPGMTRATDLRTNVVRIACSRSHGFVEPASSALRRRDMVLSASRLQLSALTHLLSVSSFRFPVLVALYWQLATGDWRRRLTSHCE